MKKWPNIGDRIKAKLLDLGFRQRNGKPDVMGFALRHGWNHVYLFRWIGGSTPDYDNIIRLAGELQVSPSWLMFGEQGVMVPTVGASGTKPLATAPARRSGRGASPTQGACGAELPEPAEESKGASAPPPPRTLRVARRRRNGEHNQGPTAPYQHRAIYRQWPKAA